MKSTVVSRIDSDFGEIESHHSSQKKKMTTGRSFGVMVLESMNGRIYKFTDHTGESH
jgi:hypothetical protein